MDKDTFSHKNEGFYVKAKKEGYRARSAYKLFDIQKKYNIFKRVFYILDIGSAPGSWLQVAKKFAEENLTKYQDKHYHRKEYKILGVDIKKVSPIENVDIMKMDITKPSSIKEIQNYLAGEKFDLILSDASIKKSGNKFSDQVLQVKLCLKILDISYILKSKGNFVIKLFQGEDFKRVYRAMKNKFQFVKSYKPRASSKKSNEIYIIGLNKK
ncbi:MAG: RlmE family RNA methyltransferase [Promethearchaeota archaeon]|jgi:23S rRNA (uridine2552-2'-O)-methyltransferase|nr:MAG: RlmE family RNA methyltransferase [Candidatus Lokiarchaeota archaeon]